MVKRGFSEGKVIKSESDLPSERDCSNAKVIEEYYFVILN